MPESSLLLMEEACVLVCNRVQGVSVYLQHSTVDCRLGRRDLINSTDELIWV